MKHAKVLHLLIATAFIATAAVGCKKQPKNITPVPNLATRAPGGNQQLGTPLGSGNRIPGDMELGGSRLPALQGDPSDIAMPMEDAEQDRATLAAETIYYDFDRSAIQPSEQPKLDAVATYLKNTPGVQLLIEGHCDERGTEEYNRSLGERRAIAAREYLIQKHQIPSNRITTSSLGEDRPASLEKTEEAYARNRRGEFVILQPQ